MFVVLSKFVVANGMEEAVAQAFRDRPRQVEQVPGFIRMEVLNPSGRTAEFWLMTWWTDEASFRGWHKSHLYHEAHRGVPKGLKLLPEETLMRTFSAVCE